MKDKRMANYHSHKMYTNLFVRDSGAKYEEYIDRALELNQTVITSVEHGYQGNYWYLNELIEQKNEELQERRKRGEENVPDDLKFIFGTEAYWVKDRHEKDRSNCHMVILAKNENGRKKINLALSKANEDGMFASRPRLDFELIFKLPKDDVFVTSACIGYWNKYEDIEDITLRFHDYFGDNFMLEVQNHNTEQQKELNRKILKLAKKHNIEIIAGLDSHYIDEEKDSPIRKKLLEDQNIYYEDEDGWYMDYPSYDEVIRRFEEQGVLTKDEILRSIENTNIIETFDDYDLNRNIKLPTLFKDKTQVEKDKIFKDIINKEWNRFKKEENIPKEEWKMYIDGIKYEVGEVIKTGMCDYFLIHYYALKKGVEYGGHITKRGRGSAVGFFINTLLGFSKVDRFKAPIKLYPERFLTSDRIIKSKSLPDVDNNIDRQEPFVQAFRDLLGEHSIYPMVAFGTLQKSSAVKMYMRTMNINADIQNEVTKQLRKYEDDLIHCETEEEKENLNIYDYIEEQYVKYLDLSKDYQGIVVSKSVHPCFKAGTLIMTDKGYKKIEEINVGDNVLTHTNEFHPVLKTMRRKSEDIYKVKITGEELEVTGNHPFYVKESYESEAIWKSVEELKDGDLVGFAINQESKLPSWDGYVKKFKYKEIKLDKLKTYFTNKDFWWIVGRWFCDGWNEDFLRKSGKNKGRKVKRTIICCSKTEENELKEIIDRIGNLFDYKVQEERTTYKIIFKNCREFHEYLNQFGKYADGKHLTNDIFDLPMNLLQSFIEGYLSADGYKISENKYSFATVSRELAYGLQTCINKAYHTYCGISIDNRGLSEKDIIEGREVNRKLQYKGLFYLKSTDRTFNKYQDGHIWCKVKSKKRKEFNDYVYNIEVEKDHSYTANNIVVHNCAHLILNGDIREEIGLVRCESKASKKSVLTACIEGVMADHYKFLKTDLLIVDVVGLTEAIWKRIDKPSPSNNQLERWLAEPNCKAWDMYAKGYTLCVNQCEKEGTKNKCKRYKMKSTGELSSFVASIRPGFASLINDYLDRKPYTTGVSQLDEVLKDSYHYMLYQESIMAFLNWLGIDMKETYDIVKKISKKVYQKHPEQMVELKDRCRDMWVKNTGSEYLFDETFKTMENAGNYCFNSAHSYCVGNDGAEIAYTKAYYPYETYECCLNRYTKKNNKDKVSALEQEMKEAFGIDVGVMMWGKDNRQFTLDKENHCIYPNLSSIKSIGKNVSEELFNLYNLGISSFFELLVYLFPTGTSIDKTVLFYTNINVIPVTTINKSMVDILINLDYFKPFAKSQKLLTFFEYYKILFGKKAPKKSTIAKKIKDENVIKIIEDNSTPTVATYTKFNSVNALDQIWNYIPDTETSILQKLKYQKDYLGYLDYRDKSYGKNCFYIESIERLKSYTKIILYNISNGKQHQVKIWNSQLDKMQQPIGAGSVIYLTKESIRKKNQVRSTGERNPDTGKMIYEPIPDKFEFWLIKYQDITYEFEE